MVLRRMVIPDEKRELNIFAIAILAWIPISNTWIVGNARPGPPGRPPKLSIPRNMRAKPKGMGGDRMRWRLMLSVLLGVALTASNNANKTIAQQQFQPSGDSPGDDHMAVPDALIPSTKVAKFRLILGRLSLDPPSHVKCERSAELACGGSERVEVTACRGIPSLHYHFVSQERNLTVDVSAAEHVRIESIITDHDAKETLKIDQPAQGLLKLSLSSKDDLTSETVDEQFKVASLSHLRVSYPHVYEKHIAPMLARLLERKPAICEVDDLLAALAASPVLTDTPGTNSSVGETLRGQVDELVEQLRSASRASRNGAEKRLRSIGLPALSLIDEALQNPLDMDTEQVMRLNRVRIAIAPKSSDNPRQLARWLASDVAYWNSVAGDLSIAQLQTVNSHLISVTGQALQPQLRVANVPARSNR